jgi:hypothetical protein
MAWLTWRTGVSAARVAVAVAILAAVVATAVEVASRTALNPFNLFGYFTVQSNLIAMVALVLAVTVPASKGRSAQWIGLLRALAVTCLVIVGVVYGTLLAPLGAAGGVPIPWANVVLHVISPVFVVADWVVVGDRPRLDLNRLWVILCYPLVWTTVVLVRGATDGWVPYPFLDPAQGYPVVAGYVAAIFVAFLLVGSFTLLATRFRGLVAVST